MGHELRIVDLNQEAGRDDRLILLAHGLADRMEIVLRRLVILVLVPVLDIGGRDRRDENLRDVEARERGLEIVEVGLQFLVAPVGDRPGAGHEGLARIHGAGLGLVEFRKRDRLARADPGTLPFAFLAAEAAEALAHIGHEARLAELSVVDHVDAESGLLADDLAHRLAQARLEGRLVDALAARA